MVLGAVVKVEVTGGYSRVLANEDLYLLLHHIENKRAAHRLRVEILPGGGS